MDLDPSKASLELPAVLLEPVCECWGELDCYPKDLGQAFDVTDAGFTLCARVDATAKGHAILQKGSPPLGWSFVAPSAQGRIAFQSGAREATEADLAPPAVVEEASVVPDPKGKPSKGANKKGDAVTEQPPEEPKVIADIGSSAADDGGWHHVAVTYCKGRIYAYLDGKIDGELGVEVQAAPAAPLIAGKRIDGIADESDAPKGIQNLQVFSTPLSAAQIAGLAAESRSLPSAVSLPLTPRQVRHFWKLRAQAESRDDDGDRSAHVAFLSKCLAAGKESTATHGDTIYGVGIDKTVRQQSLDVMTTSSSWTTVSTGGVVNIAIHANRIYGVGADNKVYKQYISSMTPVSIWRLASAGDVTSIAFHADTIYGVGIDKKVYRQSINEMSTSSSWTLASAGDVISIAVYRGTIYGVGADNKVYTQKLREMSTSSSWIMVSTGDVISVAINAGIIYGVQADNKVVKQELAAMTTSSPWIWASAGDVIDIAIKVANQSFHAEVICDFFVSLLDYTQSISLTARKAAVFAGIMQKIFECMHLRSKTTDCVGEPFSSSECFLECKKLFLAHAATASGALSSVSPDRIQIFSIADIKLLTEFVAGTLFQHFFLYQCVLVSPQDSSVTYRSVVLEGPLPPPDLRKAKMLPPKQETVASPASNNSRSDSKDVIDGNTLDPNSTSFPDISRAEVVEGGVDEDVVDNLTRALSRPKSSKEGGTVRDEEHLEYLVGEASKTVHQTIEESIQKRDEALRK